MKKMHILLMSFALISLLIWGCGKPTNPVDVPLSEDNSGVSSLAKHFDGSSVYELVVDTPLNWFAANAAARRMVAPGCRSAHLATITSQGEQDIVDDLMAGVTDNNAWLGGFQPRGELSLEDGWRWSTGPRWVYTNWAGGEPNDNPFGTFIPGSEQNLETLRGSGDWNDAPGFETKFLIVESEHCN